MQKVEWFKLQLMLSGNTYIDPINLPPLPAGKSEVDVAADYLFKLRQAMRSQLQKTLGEVFNREEDNIRYFLTVPAIWNEAGKAATRAAAIQAGFLRDENDNRLTLITEPEAAAMFCSKTGLLHLRVHDAVLIVDCGGGTVDLIAYELEEESPFTVAECTAGSGDSCGSTALNRNFSNILRAKIRKMKLPDGSKTAGKVYAKCIMDFENRIKADFRNNGQKWMVDVGIEAEFPEAAIEEGYMAFTNEEVLQCFEPVVNRILELVRNQITAIQAQNRALQVRRLFSFPEPHPLTGPTFRMSSWSAVSARPNTSFSKSNCTCRRSSKTRWCGPWTRWRPLSRAPLRPASRSASSPRALRVATTSWPPCSRSRKATTRSSTACPRWTAKTAANTRGRFLCKRVSASRSANPSRCRFSARSPPARRSCTRTCSMRATMTCVPSTPRIPVRRAPSRLRSLFRLVVPLLTVGRVCRHQGGRHPHVRPQSQAPGTRF